MGTDVPSDGAIAHRVGTAGDTLAAGAGGGDDHRRGVLVASRSAAGGGVENAGGGARGGCGGGGQGVVGGGDAGRRGRRSGGGAPAAFHLRAVPPRFQIAERLPAILAPPPRGRLDVVVFVLRRSARPRRRVVHLGIATVGRSDMDDTTSLPPLGHGQSHVHRGLHRQDDGRRDERARVIVVVVVGCGGIGFGIRIRRMLRGTFDAPGRAEDDVRSRRHRVPREPSAELGILGRQDVARGVRRRGLLALARPAFDTFQRHRQGEPRLRREIGGGDTGIPDEPTVPGVRRLPRTEHTVDAVEQGGADTTNDIAKGGGVGVRSDESGRTRQHAVRCVDRPGGRHVRGSRVREEQSVRAVPRHKALRRDAAVPGGVHGLRQEQDDGTS